MPVLWLNQRVKSVSVGQKPRGTGGVIYTLKRTVEKTSTLFANMSTVNVLFWLAYTTVDFVLQKMLNYNATFAVDVCLHSCGV